MTSGSTQSIGMRSAEVLVKVKYLKKGNKVFQSFIFDSGKNTFALKDSRFQIYNKFESKVKEYSLEGRYPSRFSFLERIDSEDKSVLVFSVIEEINLENFYFIVAGFIPKNAGCNYCIHNTNKADTFIQCGIKNKVFPKCLKSCSLFKEIPNLFTT